MGYALLTQDIILFIPNVAAMTVAVVQSSLYIWTLGNIDDNHFVIKAIKQVFLGPKKILKPKTDNDLNDGDIEGVELKFGFHNEAATETKEQEDQEQGVKPRK